MIVELILLALFEFVVFFTAYKALINKQYLIFDSCFAGVDWGVSQQTAIAIFKIDQFDRIWLVSCDRFTTPPDKKEGVMVCL